MANKSVFVRATQRGFFDELREAGDIFAIPKDLWDDVKRRPRWVVSADEADADAEDDGDDEPAEDKPKRGRKPKAETVQAPTAKPFADAPEPVRAKSEINDLTGGTRPDWVKDSGDI